MDKIKILECHSMILNFQNIIEKETDLIKKEEYVSIINNLRDDWKKSFKTEYPIINYNNKLNNITNVLEQIKNELQNELLKSSICIYNYGSFVYGTYIEKTSDKDYIIIVPNDKEYPEQLFINNEQFNIFKEKDWIRKMKNNDIECLECYFLDDKFKIKEDKKYELILDKNLVRKNISTTASNSYVKCKKKLTVDNSYSPRTGKKSLWHALRLLDFGIQIMSKNKIYDYSSLNHLYNEIMNSPDDWEYLKEKYQPLYNNYKSNFKINHNKCDIER